MQETAYQIQIPALDYTEGQIYFRATKDTNPYDFWLELNINFMQLQIIFIKPYKLEFLNVTNNNNSLDQILSPKNLQQYSYEKFFVHHALHTNKHHIFVTNKFSSPYSPSAQYCLDNSYLHGRIRNYDPFKDYLSYYSACDPNRLLIVPREALSFNDAHFHVFLNRPPPPYSEQKHSFFDSFISHPIPSTALHFYNHLLTVTLLTPQLHF